MFRCANFDRIFPSSVSRNPPRPEHREHRRFRQSIKNTPLAGACGAGIAQTLGNIRQLTPTPKPRVLGSSPSTPGCEIPRKPFRHWLPGVFPWAQNLCVSVMILPFFAQFCLVYHRRNIKNAPRFLAEGGKEVVIVRFAGTCGGRSSGARGGSRSAGNWQRVLQVCENGN